MLFLGVTLNAFGDNFSLQGSVYPAKERENRTHLLKGEISHLCFYLWGKRDDIKFPELVLDLPHDVRVLNAWHGSQAGGSIKLEVKEGTVASLGKGTRINWTIKLNEELLRKRLPGKGPDLWSLSNLFVLLETSDSIEEGETEIFWRLRIDGKEAIKEKIGVTILPALGVVHQPARIKFYPYGLSLFNCPDQGIREKMFALFDKVNIKGGVRHFSVATGQELAKKGWYILDFGGEGWGEWAGGYWGVRKPEDILRPGLTPEDIIITLKNGSKSKNRKSICPTYMIENGDVGEPYFEEVVKRVKECYWEGVSGMMNDYEIAWESREVSPTQSCFCLRCMEAFAKQSHINWQCIKGLTPGELLSNYKPQWLKFRHLQLVKMMDIYNRAVKTVNPRLESVVCSAPLTWMPEYPIKVAEYDEYIDNHWPMAYKAGPDLLDLVDVTCRSLKKPVIPILKIHSGVGSRKGFTAEETYMNIIASCASGAKGIAFFVGDISFDGAYIKAFAEASDKLSILEKFYLDGQREDALVTVKADSWDVIKHRLHKLNGNLMLTVFNYTDETDIKISVAGMSCACCSLYRLEKGSVFKKFEKNGYWTAQELEEGFSCRLPSKSVTFFMISDEA